MITRRCFNARAAASVLASGFAARRANALAWPTHPVRIVVPFAAGGPTDVIARIVGERLAARHVQEDAPEAVGVHAGGDLAQNVHEGVVLQGHAPGVRHVMRRVSRPDGGQDQARAAHVAHARRARCGA